MSGPWIGYVGLVAFALAWIPQSYETVRAGRCGANRTFLVLAAVGSLSLTIYALQMGDPVFSSLNALTTAGAAVNLWYSLFPHDAQHPSPGRHLRRRSHSPS